MNKKSNKYYELNLIQLLPALWHRLWAIVLAAVVCASATFCYASFAVTPLYEAEALLYVNNSSFSLSNTSFSISTSELSAAQSLVDTYIVILKTRTTLNKVIEEADLDYSYDELKNMLSAEPVNNTEIFKVKVKSPKPAEAEKIANTIAYVLPQTIFDVVDGSDVRIVDYAVVPAKKASPNITLFTAIGILIGIAVAALIIIIQEMLDTLIHNEDYLLETYDLPVLAVIPNLFTDNDQGYYSAYGSSESTEVK